MQSDTLAVGVRTREVVRMRMERFLIFGCLLVVGNAAVAQSIRSRAGGDARQVGPGSGCPDVAQLLEGPPSARLPVVWLCLDSLVGWYTD